MNLFTKSWSAAGIEELRRSTVWSLTDHLVLVLHEWARFAIDTSYQCSARPVGDGTIEVTIGKLREPLVRVTMHVALAPQGRTDLEACTVLLGGVKAMSTIQGAKTTAMIADMFRAAQREMDRVVRETRWFKVRNRVADEA